MKISIGNITFLQNEKHHLVMDTPSGALEFVDCVSFGITVPGRCSTVKTRDVFSRQTQFTQKANTLFRCYAVLKWQLF